jgi:putative restriction endonuclease
VRGFVANTDFDWFQTLRARPEIDEVNFWQPSGRHAFRVLAPGELLFFRLKSPRNAIGGFGVFVRHDIVPAWHAWETFGEGNGARELDEMLHRIAKYRRRQNPEFTPDPLGNYLIGCLLLVEPVFFAADEWVRQPDDWPRNVVQGKSYDLAVGEGARLARECLERVEDASRPTLYELALEARFGPPRLVTPRLGQGTFRISVEQAYGRSCAITGEHSLPVLEAAHIKPYAAGGPHSVSNGLLMRRDIHRLFDLGYVTVTQAGRFEVSTSLHADFANGRTYYALQGRNVRAPVMREHRPAHEFLEWHSAEVFRA